jgi:hypothetical protein
VRSEAAAEVSWAGRVWGLPFQADALDLHMIRELKALLERAGEAFMTRLDRRAVAMIRAGAKETCSEEQRLRETAVAS